MTESVLTMPTSSTLTTTGESVETSPEFLIRSPEVCRRADISYRQLDYWCRSGLLAPTREARGSGTQREFSRADLRVVLAIKVLLPLFDQREWNGTPGSGRDADLLAILADIRAGATGMVEVQRGIWYDLDVLCSE